MTPHRRFLACMRYAPMDRPPLWEMGPWDATVTAWMAETGLPADAVLAWMAECDPVCNPGVDFAFRPPFPATTVAVDDDYITKVDRMGQTYRARRVDPGGAMPEYIGFPVRTAADWAEIKRRLDPTDPARYPADWDARTAQWRAEEPVLNLYGFVESYYGGPSLFGFVRMLLGPERALYAFYDEPDLVHDMMETATEFALAVLPRALREAPVSYVQFWEDMCFKNGPLVSPALVREFMAPRYRRLTAAIRAAGVDLIFLDSDGDVSALLPIWLECGINGVFPMEQAAGNDLAAYRQEYGRDLRITGGIDKRALAQGRAAIDAELDAKIPLVHAGGYIPTLDHAIPPDVPYADFMYYWERKKALLGV